MIVMQAFGSFDLHDDGESLHGVLSQPKRAALLAYLVLARPGELQRRDALLALFWPELDQARGRNALSQSLTFLRRGLPDGVLVTRGSEEVGVNAHRVRCDAVEFEAAVAGGRWEEALELYRGPLLEGLHVGGAPEFVRWLDLERERLRELASGAAWSGAHASLAAGALTEAERLAQRALRLVPTDESPVRDFIDALAAAGDRAAALRFYEKFVDVLADELEVEPAPETVAVAVAVRARKEPVQPVNGALTPDAGPQVEARPSTGAAPRPAWFAWRRITVVAVLAALSFVGYGLVRAGRTGEPGTLIGEGKAARYDQVLVADFTSAEDPGLGPMVSEWLRFDLDRSDVVRPVGPAAVGAALRRMARDSSLAVDAQTAHEIAVRDGYPLVVVGEIDPVGRGYVVLARLEAADGGEVLGRFRAVAASDAELADALGGISGQIRERIGESLRAIRRSAPLAQVPTSSLEALRLYSDAMRLWTREDRPLDAVPLLERAITIDTTFAAAYWALGFILNHALTDWDRQAELGRKAYEHRDRLNEYERLLVEGGYLFDQLVSWADTATAQPDECDINEPMLHLYETYVRRHPDDPRPLQDYGVYLERTGHREEALATFRRLTEMDPSVGGGWANLFYGQLGMGRFEEARSTLGRWQTSMPESVSEFDWAGANMAARQGDYARADSVVEHIVGYAGLDPQNSVVLAQLDAVRGRMEEAWRHYEYPIRRMQQAGHPGAAFLWATNRALTRLVALGDPAGATADMTAALQRLPDTLNLAGTWVDAGLVYAFAGDAARAQAQLDSLTRHGRGNWSVSRGVLGAAIALAEGRAKESLDTLAATAIPCTFNASADLRVDPRLRRILAGRAYEALQQPDSAIAAYEAYFTDPPIAYPVNLDAVFLFDTLERLGALHDARGDSAQAATYYARAADLWNGADPALQPRVQRLRERVAALSSGDRSGTS
jgi:DNA-binding SARP family transcriptional activator